uniref:Variant surface glycoprotein 1125.4166 n=1 Tax=Trypanosoma brucei TaxID=5691 RepID=A0A1J0RA01_9TRYP|nr:variant surface glycoprotein 1125.4166 [Trypanosoma brucei]
MQAFLCVFISILTAAAVQGAPTANYNADANAKPCPALKLADAPIEFEPKITPAPTKPSPLFNLNMSLADAAWRQMFAPTSEGGTRKRKEKPGKDINADWNEKWETWAQAALELSGDGVETKLRENYGLKDATAKQVERLRHAIAAYADAAYEAYNAFTKANANTPEADPKMKTELQQIVHGGGEQYDDENEANRLYKGTKAGYATVCVQNGGYDPTLTIAATYACICSGNDQLTSVHPCVKDTTSNMQWASDGIVTKANWANLRRGCPETVNTPITASRLATAGQLATSAIHTKGSDAYIGSTAGSSCDGSNNDARVKFTGVATSGKLNKQPVTWITRLKDVENKLKSREAYNAAATKTTAQLEHISKLVYATVKQAKLIDDSRNNADKKDGQQKPTTKNLQSDCAATTNPEECKPEVGCKYNETSKACEKDPKPSVSKPNEETGGKDGKTEEKCIKHGTDQNARKKDSNCKWDGKECKDSSILVNKQFALSVVSAAFVALLF